MYVIKQKKILILSYVFPPYPGIGGRRWAKFAKYLNKSGHDVYVIAAKNHFDQTSNWDEDIKGLKNAPIYLNIGFSKILEQTPTSLVDKLKYRLVLAYTRLQFKGNPYHRAVFWNQKITKTISQLIKEKSIENVIVSASPFMLLVHVSKLIPLFPNVKFIADFRDPWTSNRTAFGFEHLSNQRKEYEVKNEQKVLNRFHSVISVADNLTEELRKKSTSSNTDFVTILNGFDPEDFKKGIKQSVDQNKIKFVFLGTFYSKATHHFKDLVDSLNGLKISNTKLYQQLEFHFYGYQPDELKEIIKMSEIDIVHLHNPIPLAEVYPKIQEADLCMLFLSDDITYSFSTKFCEYISQRKKIAVFSNPGYTSDYVQKNKVGYHFSPGNFESTFNNIYKDYKNANLSIDNYYDVDQFNIRHLTQKVEKELI